MGAHLTYPPWGDTTSCSPPNLLSTDCQNLDILLELRPRGDFCCVNSSQTGKDGFLILGSEKSIFASVFDKHMMSSLSFYSFRDGWFFFHIRARSAFLARKESKIVFYATTLALFLSPNCATDAYKTAPTKMVLKGQQNQICIPRSKLNSVVRRNGPH